jgi:putative flippase GtrA
MEHSKQSTNGFARGTQKIVNLWKSFKAKHPTVAQFIVFFILSNGVTVLQLIMMPLFKYMFAYTPLISTDFQVWRVGNNLDGTPYFIFDYQAGRIADGGGGGLAYFLAVQITLGIAQIINFFAQRNITFKSNTNPWVAAGWYLFAYVMITIIAAALQGWYKTPIYNLFMNTLGWGATGETTADVITMIINSAISFWVFFPIFKIIFKQKKEISST